MSADTESSDMTDESRQIFLSDALERLMPELRAFARSLARDAALADDLVQDTCLMAWDKRDQFKAGAAAKPWLFKILRNQFYQLKRRDWRNVGLEPEQAETALVSATCLESSSDMRVLDEVIQSLPSGQREALILVLAAGYTYEEAGEICGCSAGTIKSRVSRARQTVLYKMEQVTNGTSSGERVETGSFDRLLASIDELTVSRRAAA